MYALVSAIGKSLGGGQDWCAIDLGDMTFSTVVQTFSTVCAVLTNPFLGNPVSLNLNDIAGTITDQQQTFNQYLAALGDMALPTSDTIPTLDTRYARYQDAFQAGYAIEPISPVASLSSPLPTAEKTDLFLTRARTSYSSFFQSCMVTVNGFFHLIDSDGQNGIWVTDGMKSVTHAKKNKVGILDFQDLGTLTYVPITREMLFKQIDEQNLGNHTYLNLGRDLTGYTVMAVIGGYLHVLDPKTVTLVGADTIMIDFNNLPLFDRWYESKRFIDLSAMPLTSWPDNPHAFTVTEMISDAFIGAYLTLSQSFIVLIDNTELWTEFLGVEAPRWPHAYISYVQPVWPLVTGCGKIAEYWPVPEDRQWSLRVEDNFRNNPIYRTVDAKVETGLSDSRNPIHATGLSPAYFLQIGCDVNLSGG
ncbi:hypothetical protein HDG34_003205 [Paraburkholderia sp. HC6.4b]|uniref:hypothetical protein n=1 Tax=unclassified Paraburkholderia TaxID=2615204 RepID=UPI001607FD56|nr:MULTISPECIES: hypothetical protein [unclassified Paraburkholderia]MBB5409264.1 hypothetical protein [Paraburkholderia sp. HC6.4b]MBB5450992.1 hypothetical protein [Paraburkholderia sp. Kb1A]